MIGRRIAWPALVLALGGTAMLPAQQPADSLTGRSLATRTALEERATQLEHQAGSDEALARVRARLRDGDFRPGDRIRLRVQGESTLTDTFTVGSDTALRLPSPVVGTLPLHGVLHSELQPHVSRYLDRFLVRTVVEAEALVRLSVVGGVVRGGYYGVPTDALLSDALMAAGGTTNDADMDKVRIQRNRERLLEGRALRRAIADGITVDAAGLRDGDEIVVPQRRPGGFMSGLNVIWVMVSLAGGIYGLSRAFH